MQKKNVDKKKEELKKNDDNITNKSDFDINNNSYLVKTRNSYSQLIDKYTTIFKTFVNNGSKIKELSKEEKYQLFLGIKDITNYITEGFLYTLNISKKGIDPREKILIAIYYKIINHRISALRKEGSNIYSSYEEDKNTIISSINEIIRDKVEFSVFCALGIENYHNRSFTWDHSRQKEYNFIYFTKYRVAAIILEKYLKDEVEALNETLYYKDYYNSKLISDRTMSDSNMEKDIEELSGRDLIKLSECDWIIPIEYYDNIVDFLDGKIDESSLLLGIKKTRKILGYIYKSLKKKGYIVDNKNESEIGDL